MTKKNELGDLYDPTLSRVPTLILSENLCLVTTDIILELAVETSHLFSKYDRS